MLVIEFDVVLWLICKFHVLHRKGSKFIGHVMDLSHMGLDCPLLGIYWFEVFPMMLKIGDSYEGNEHKHHFGTI